MSNKSLQDGEIIAFYYFSSGKGKYSKGPKEKLVEVAHEHHALEKTVSRTWRRGQDFFEDGAPTANVSTWRKGNRSVKKTKLGKASNYL